MNAAALHSHIDTKFRNFLGRLLKLELFVLDPEVNVYGALFQDCCCIGKVAALPFRESFHELEAWPEGNLHWVHAFRAVWAP